MSRLITLKDNLATAPLEKNWNRLMSLQGVFANIGINILNVRRDTIIRWFETYIYFDFSVPGKMDILEFGDKKHNLKVTG